MVQKPNVNAVKIYKQATLSLQRTQRYLLEWHDNIQEVLSHPHFSDLDEAAMLKSTFSEIKNRFPKAIIHNQSEARSSARKVGRAKQNITRVQEYIRSEEKFVQAKAGYEAASAWKLLQPEVENLKRRIVTCQTASNKASKAVAL